MITPCLIAYRHYEAVEAKITSMVVDIFIVISEHWKQYFEMESEQIEILHKMSVYFWTSLYYNVMYKHSLFIPMFRISLRTSILKANITEFIRL